MTGPESHKARRDVDAFVTGAQQGESSSGTSSSRSCDTDDDDSSTDSDDIDGEFDEDDPLSLETDKKWATADSYNLTTFDQTEGGTWAINQPLPLPLWAKEPKSALNVEKVNSHIYYL